MRKNTFASLLENKYLFYGTLLLNVVLLLFSKFYPSMDGPAHLYNSNIILQLIKGNSHFAEFYILNPLPLPNWTSQAILLIFNSLLPAWMAEKILIILYVTGMALSFRYLVKVLNPNNLYLSILIFPFIYSFLFHLGFYNFSISFIFYFMTLGYWLHSRDADNFRKHFILLFLITGSYFSNLVIFGFLGLTVGVFIIYFSIESYLYKKDFSSAFMLCGKELLKLFIVSVPGLILLLIFYSNAQFFPSDQSYGIKELVKWINDARPFIVYDYSREEIITEQFFHLLLMLFTISIIFKGRETGKYIDLGKADIILIPLGLSILLYFMVPNGSGAGMMSDRFCLILYIFGLIWVVARAVYSRYNSVIILFFLILHFGLLFYNFHGTILKLDEHANDIKEADKYVSENSIILPVNFSDNWLQPHFSNYLGIDKPIIILENYQASVNWFPVKWNHDSLPNIMLNGTSSISGLQWITNTSSEHVRQIDYILLYGDQAKIDEPKWAELKEHLSGGFILRYRSESNFVMLFEKI
jgi:hypothetical protein